jgi:eukaryotic-like serine/threonine-protein kinase
VSGEPRRYALYDEIATGGMASVYFGRFQGAAGFSRVVAVKKLHPQYARDPEFATMILDEARMASRVRHPNVVPTLDVIQDGQELLLIMEYVEGEALSRLLDVANDAGETVPIEVAVAIVAGMLHGLHAAHEATAPDGEPLELVHRDVSPQNVLVGVDGVPRLLDFGVAKAVGRSRVTRGGELRGKLQYMAPEQLRGDPVTRRADIWGAAVVAWEVLTGQMLFGGNAPASVYGQVLSGKITPPSAFDAAIPPEIDRIVLRGLCRGPDGRFETARAMAMALEDCVRPATAAEVGVWVRRLAARTLAERAVRLADIERALRAGDDVMDATLPMPVKRPARSGTWVVFAAAGALGLVAVAANTHARGGGGAPAPRLESGLALAVQPARFAALMPVAPADAQGPAPTPAPTATTEDADAASAAAQPAATRGRPPAGAAAKRPAAGAKGAKPSGQACYFQDSAGIWHIRPECL